MNAKDLVSNEDWPAPKRSSFVYSMSQQERIEALRNSEWPDLDWTNEWVHIDDYPVYDRQIDVDARSGALHETFNIKHISAEDEAEEYLRSVIERSGRGIPMSMIECREDGKYLKGTDVSLRTYTDYAQDGRYDEFIEDHELPSDIEECIST